MFINEWSGFLKMGARDWRTSWMEKKPFIVAIGALFACICASYATAEDQVPTKEQIMSDFAEDVLFRIGHEKTRTLAKWETPVRFGILSDEGINPNILSKTAEYIDVIQKATGHQIIFTSKNVNFLAIMSSDIYVELSKRENIVQQFFTDGVSYKDFFEESKSRNYTCGGKILMSKQNSILAHLIFVSLAHDHTDEQVEACIAFQLVEGMGVVMRGENRKKNWNLAPADISISAEKKIILNLLYKSSIKAGMSEGDALKEVSRLLHDAP